MFSVSELRKLQMLNKVIRKLADMKDARFVRTLFSLIAEKAQAVYDAWEQNEDGEDEEYGAGGICQDVAEEIVGVLDEHEAATVFSSVGDNHVYVITKLSEGVYVVDIPPSVYESGSGYVWRKQKDVQITADDVVLDWIDSDPENFENYLDE
jgi:hypothetical protein